jgi:hypothetical protein
VAAAWIAWKMDVPLDRGRPLSENSSRGGAAADAASLNRGGVGVGVLPVGVVEAAAAAADG